MNIERQPGWLHRPPLRGAASPRPRAQRGVTLVELMVVLGIAAIILAFAVPNFREFVARNRLDGAAQELLATLQFARSEATRRGEQVTIRLAGTAGSKNWGSGWAMFVDTDRDGVLDTGEEVIRQGMAMNAPLTLIGSSNLDTFIAFGASPRATLYLVRGAQALALMAGRPYVLPEDVKGIAPDVLRHRIHVSYEAEAEGIDGEEIGRRILEQVRVP